MPTRITDEVVVKKFSSLQSSAKSRGILFEMTIKKVRSLLTAKKCYFTGIEFIDDHPDFKRSMDRIESDSGYFDDNVVPCIALINNLKANLSYREICLIERGMRKHFRKYKKDIVSLKNKRMPYEQQVEADEPVTAVQTTIN